MGKGSVYFLQPPGAKAAKEKDCNWHSHTDTRQQHLLSSGYAEGHTVDPAQRHPQSQSLLDFAPPKCNPQAFSFVKVSV